MSKTTFVAHIVVQVDDPQITRKQIRAYVQDALDTYDAAAWHGHDLEPISAKVRRDVDKQ